MAHNYPEIIHDILPDKHFEFSEVEEMSKEAHKFHQEPKFALGENNRLAGYVRYVGLIDVLEVVAHGPVSTAFDDLPAMIQTSRREHVHQDVFLVPQCIINNLCVVLDLSLL